MSMNRIALGILSRLVGPEDISRWIPGDESIYDVAISYCHYGVSPRYVVSRVRAQRKYMWYHHGAYERSGRGRRKDARTYAKFDGVVAVSRPVRDTLSTQLPALRTKLVTIANPINIERIIHASLKPLTEPFPENTLSLVTISRLSHEKGVDIAVRTACELKERGIQFSWRVVGDGPERTRLQDLADELQVASEVEFLGERTNPFPILRAADIYVQCSRVEAESMTIKEAMALRKPIVASALPPIVQLLGEGRYGVTCAIDAVAFADEIVTLARANEREAFMRGVAGELPFPDVAEQLDGLLQIG